MKPITFTGLQQTIGTPRIGCCAPSGRDVSRISNLLQNRCIGHTCCRFASLPLSAHSLCPFLCKSVLILVMGADCGAALSLIYIGIRGNNFWSNKEMGAHTCSMRLRLCPHGLAVRIHPGVGLTCTGLATQARYFTMDV